MHGTLSDALPVLRRVRGAGLELAWREWHGDEAGAPIVLLHGITGSSADWHATASLLAGRRIIALDARGHGASDWDPGEAYQVDMHFADLATAMEQLAIDRCVLAGFSMGGGVAMLTAAALPERVGALAVIDAYPHPANSTGSARIARWVAADDHARRSYDPAISRHFRELLAEGRATRADLRPMWQATQCPTLLVRGADSQVLPAGIAQEMQAMLPHARLETIAGVGHPIPLRKPAELARLILELAAAAG